MDKRRYDRDDEEPRIFPVPQGDHRRAENRHCERLLYRSHRENIGPERHEKQHRKREFRRFGHLCDEPDHKRDGYRRGEHQKDMIIRRQRPYHRQVEVKKRVVERVQVRPVGKKAAYRRRGAEDRDVCGCVVIACPQTGKKKEDQRDDGDLPSGFAVDRSVVGDAVALFP